MSIWRIAWIPILFGASLLVLAQPAAAQREVRSMSAPDYGSGASAGALSNRNFNTPESDGRPGVKFFALGVQAFRKGDFRHAVDMYKVAASWAYKPAEYNLGVMYFKGQGVPVDHARGAAWMVLAAERGDATYVRARDLMVTVLSKAEFERTDEIWGELKHTYGDKVAMRRAKARWAWARAQRTGSRVGGVTGELFVGTYDTGGAPVEASRSGKAQMFASGFGFMQGGSMDGSVAYRQFQRSDNPYDPAFQRNRTGIVTVEPLQPVRPAAGKAGEDKSPSAGQPATNPPDHRDM